MIVASMIPANESIALLPLSYILNDWGLSWAWLLAAVIQKFKSSNAWPAYVMPLISMW